MPDEGDVRIYWMTAELWSLVNDRRAVLRARVDALDKLGLDELVWLADTVDQSELLAAFARELHARSTLARGTHTRRPSLARSAFTSSRGRTHLAVAPADLRAICGARSS